MTVALALSLKDRGLPQLTGQVLIYPVLGADVDTPSYRRNAEAPCLTRSDMIYYLEFLSRPPRQSQLERSLRGADAGTRCIGPATGLHRGRRT